MLEASKASEVHCRML